MASRKPPGADWESWVDALVREGRDRGDFDNLPGHGKPIEGLDKPHDDLWWVRKKLKDEGVSYLPPALALRKDREDTLAAIDRLRSEAGVREALEALNERIRALNRRPVQGPPSTVMPVDIDGTVAKWRARRAVAGAAPPAQLVPGVPAPVPAPVQMERATRARRGASLGWFGRRRAE